MHSPLISVVIPLYNKEDSILETVDSVFNQSFKDFELLIIDDGSTDRSVALLGKIQDKRLRIVSKPNGGVSDARNFGAKLAKADFIFYLDADDLLLDDCLLTFSDLLSKNEDIYVFTANFKIIKNTSEQIFCSYLKEGIVSNPLKMLWNRKIFPRTGAMLFNKKCFDEIGFFRTDITIYEDFDFIINLLKKYSVVSTPKIVLAYLLDYNSLSQKRVPLNKELAYYLNLKGKPFFEKLIFAENIYAAYKKRIKLKDKSATTYLWKKNKNYLVYFIIAFSYRKFLIFNQKIKKLC